MEKSPRQNFTANEPAEISRDNRTRGESPKRLAAVAFAPFRANVNATVAKSLCFSLSTIAQFLHSLMKGGLPIIVYGFFPSSHAFGIAFRMGLSLSNFRPVMFINIWDVSGWELPKIFCVRVSAVTRRCDFYVILEKCSRV